LISKVSAVYNFPKIPPSLPVSPINAIIETYEMKYKIITNKAEPAPIKHLNAFPIA